MRPALQASRMRARHLALRMPSAPWSRAPASQPFAGEWQARPGLPVWDVGGLGWAEVGRGTKRAEVTFRADHALLGRLPICGAKQHVGC